MLELIKKNFEHYIVEKVWGEEVWLYNGEPCGVNLCGKLLKLKQDHYCSLHCHKKKFEVFWLMSGKVKMIIQKADESQTHTWIMNPGDSQVIPIGMFHSFSGVVDSILVEFSTHHEENDSYRRTQSGVIERLGDTDAPPAQPTIKVERVPE